MVQDHLSRHHDLSNSRNVERADLDECFFDIFVGLDVVTLKDVLGLVTGDRTRARARVRLSPRPARGVAKSPHHVIPPCCVDTAGGVVNTLRT